MDSFSLDKLQALCEQERWAEAADEAESITWICRRNDGIVNPRFYLRKPTPCRSAPSDRIHAVLCRLSRHKIIEGADARALAFRMAHKWSGNSGHTMRAFDFLYSQGRYWRGDWRKDWLEEYADLTKLARQHKWQWCNLAQHALQVRAHKAKELAAQFVELAETREVLRDLNKAVRERVSPSHRHRVRAAAEA